MSIDRHKETTVPATPAREFTETTDRWVTPALIRPGDRCEIVSVPGLGKSTLIQQWAARSAVGLHPLADIRIRPVRVLYADVDSTEATLRRGLGAATEGLHGAADANLFVFHQLVGLHSDSAWRRLRDAVEQVEPELICIGPLYKLGSFAAPDETAARLDSLRQPSGWSERPESALMVEHHAAEGSIQPADADLWQRWPDLGLALTAAPCQTGPAPDVEISRFRETREGQSWPTALLRGGEGMRWTPEWEDDQAKLAAVAAIEAAAEADR